MSWPKIAIDTRNSRLDYSPTTCQRMPNQGNKPSRFGTPWIVCVYAIYFNPPVDWWKWSVFLVSSDQLLGPNFSSVSSYVLHTVHGTCYYYMLCEKQNVVHVDVTFPHVPLEVNYFIRFSRSIYKCERMMTHTLHQQQNKKTRIPEKSLSKRFVLATHMHR